MQPCRCLFNWNCLSMKMNTSARILSLLNTALIQYALISNRFNQESTLKFAHNHAKCVFFLYAIVETIASTCKMAILSYWSISCSYCYSCINHYCTNQGRIYITSLMLRTEKKKTEINQQWNYQQINGIRKKKQQLLHLLSKNFPLLFANLWKILINYREKERST